MSKYRVLVKDVRVRAFEVEALTPDGAREQVEEGAVDECLAQEVYTESDVDSVEPIDDSLSKPTS